jgi:hypothetical protein
MVPVVHAAKPHKETVVVHTTRTRERDASGGGLDLKGAILPMAAGIAGGAATVYATSKLNFHPVAVAGGAAALGLIAAATLKSPTAKRAALGAAIGAGTLGGVTLVGSLFTPKPAATDKGKRSADGDGFVTRTELNDALGKLADAHKETQMQATNELLSALRKEIKQIVDDTETNNKPASSPMPRAPSMTMPFTGPLPTRGADGDDYMRNAYGDDFRDADGDEYMRNAYGDDLRDAAFYEERDAAGYYDERDAGGFDERDASGYDERDASVYEEAA